MIWWHIVLIVILSYLFGNISIARIISSTKKQDITKMGSGNPGTTNVLRNYGLGLGVLTLFMDMLKGVIPCLVVFLLTHNYSYLYIAGVSAMLGHVFPVFFKFKGGKGIATMLGVFMVADPAITAIVMVVALVSWLLFKYGSVASFLCITGLTIVEGLKSKSLDNPDKLIVSILLFAIFLLTWWAHRQNIKRLIAGRESKVDLIASAKKKIKNNTVGK